MSIASEYSGLTSKGWECPKCGRIITPYQNFCPFCIPKKNSTDMRSDSAVGTFVNDYVKIMSDSNPSMVSSDNNVKNRMSREDKSKINQDYFDTLMNEFSMSFDENTDDEDTESVIILF